MATPLLVKLLVGTLVPINASALLLSTLQASPNFLMLMLLHLLLEIKWLVFKSAADQCGHPPAVLGSRRISRVLPHCGH